MNAPEYRLTESPIGDLILDGSKVGYFRERVEAWERGERIAPIMMDVAWTRKCQAACSFCYAQAQASEGGEITPEHAFAFLHDAAEIGIKAISYISDGESTLVDYYDDAVVCASELGIKVGAGTNGIRLDQPRLEKILPHLSYLRVNFSAGEKKRYAEIMGLKQPIFDKVIANLKNARRIIDENGYACVLNVNLVCEPKDSDQLVPFARLAKEIGVHYAIIKQCATDPDGVLEVDYRDYERIRPELEAAESLSDERTKIVVKWERLKDEGKRHYSRCYGPPFQLQMSGNGLIAPCGPLFNERYKAFHIGNITRQRFRDIFASDRYWEVMRYLSSEHFDPRNRCGTSCLQHLTNDWLFRYKAGKVGFPDGPAPAQVEFV